MEVIYLIVCIVAGSLQSVCKKQLNARCQNCEFALSALISSFSLIWFLIITKDLAFVPALLPYALVFSICYATAAVTCVLALNTGSMGLTELMLAYSAMLPLLYGIIFLDDPVTIWKILGIALLLLSFVFTYCRRQGQKFTFRKSWLVYVILLFLSNGGCGVVMRMQQKHFAGAFDGTFMVMALVLVVLLLLGVSLLRKENVLTALRKGWLFSGLSGLCNGVANYCSLMCLLMIPGTIYYPVSSAGGLTLSYAISVIAFKEKFTLAQVIGFVLGILSMILVNIS